MARIGDTPPTPPPSDLNQKDTKSTSKNGRVKKLIAVFNKLPLIQSLSPGRRLHERKAAKADPVATSRLKPSDQRSLTEQVKKTGVRVLPPQKAPAEKSSTVTSSTNSHNSTEARELTSAEERLAQLGKTRKQKKNRKAPPPLRPDALKALKKAMTSSGSKSKGSLRSNLVDSMAKYYANTLLSEAKKEKGVQNKVIALVSTLQQMSGNAGSLDAIRAVVQKDINNDVSRAMAETGQNLATSDKHPLDVFGELTDVKIERQMETNSAIDTRSIDTFLQEVLQKQNGIIKKELSSQLRKLTRFSNLKSEWQKAEPKLQEKLRKDIQSNANSAKTKASSDEKKNAIQETANSSLADRMEQSKRIFMDTLSSR